MNRLNASSDLSGRKTTLTLGPSVSHLVTVQQDDNGFWGNSNGGIPRLRRNEIKGNIAASFKNDYSHLWKFDWPSNADARAANKFLSAVRGAYTKFSSGTFFGEIKQTINMLAHPAQGISKLANEYLRKVGKAKRRFPKDWYKEAPGLWLEQSFGWKPFLADVQNAFDALNSLLEQEHVEKIKGSGKSEKMVDDHIDGGSYQLGVVPLLYARNRIRILESETVRYYGTVSVQAATTAKERYARWGFTPDDFVPTVWELLPWSFLIDYFASIGDLLDASYAQTGNINWVSKVRRRTSQMSIVNFPYDPGGWPVAAEYRLVSSQPSFIISERTDVNRYASVGVPTPSLYIKMNGPTAGQWANMSALFGQACVNLSPQRKTGRNYRL